MELIFLLKMFFQNNTNQTMDMVAFFQSTHFKNNSTILSSRPFQTKTFHPSKNGHFLESSPCSPLAGVRAMNIHKNLLRLKSTNFLQAYF